MKTNTLAQMEAASCFPGPDSSTDIVDSWIKLLIICSTFSESFLKQKLYCFFYLLLDQLILFLTFK
jgi:hypothetical protein